MQQKINPICIPIVEDCYFSNRNSIRAIEEFRNYLVFTIGEVVNMLWEIRWLWNSLGTLLWSDNLYKFRVCGFGIGYWIR